jgi:hypothetical protein
MNTSQHDPELREQLLELDAPELTDEFYRQVRTQAAAPKSHAVRPRRLAFGGAVVLAAALALVAAVEFGDEGPNLGLIDDAYAAVSQTNGVAHYVIKYGDPATTGHYEEHWADLSRPGHRRIVITARGTFLRQLVYVGPTESRMFSAEGEDARQSKTVILREPPVPGISDGSEPNRLNLDPVQGYREMLRTGEVESEREVTVDGRPAYELKIRATLRARAATIRYVVDRNTFYPIEHEVNGGGGIRFVEYEILPADRSLLQPASNPSPYESTP